MHDFKTVLDIARNKVMDDYAYMVLSSYFESAPRVFWLVRDEDETGVSGTGVVAQGIEFKNGKVAMSWLTEVTSVAVYDSRKEVEAIHGHNGKTRIVWSRPAPPRGE